MDFLADASSSALVWPLGATDYLTLAPIVLMLPALSSLLAGVGNLFLLRLLRCWEMCRPYHFYQQRDLVDLGPSVCVTPTLFTYSLISSLAVFGSAVSTAGCSPSSGATSTVSPSAD